MFNDLNTCCNSEKNNADVMNSSCINWCLAADALILNVSAYMLDQCVQTGHIHQKHENTVVFSKCSGALFR